MSDRTYTKRKIKHNLVTIQPRTAYFLNKYRTKKINIIFLSDWENGEKKNAEKYEKCGDTITIVIDDNFEPVWSSHS